MRLDDGALVSRVADGALLIARQSRTSVEALARARESPDRVGARLLGVVLNAAPNAQLPKATRYGYDPKVQEVSVGELLH